MAKPAKRFTFDTFFDNVSFDTDVVLRFIEFSDLGNFFSWKYRMDYDILSIEEREGKTFVAKYFQERWEELGFQVRYIRIGEEINIESSLFTTENIEEYIKAESQPDIVLIEYPSIQGNSVPPHLLSSSQVNILIANVRRVWKNSDKEFVSYLREITKNTSLYLYLNNASREAVEDFTGQLPPQTSMRSFTNRMMYMGLTATNSAIK